MRILPTLILFFSLAAFGASAQTTTRSGKDYAVFFYVTKFQPQWQALPETETEAKALKTELETNFGFECHLVPNPTKQQIRETLAAWNNRLGPNDQILYFFSMHGHYRTASDLGYLVAADGKFDDRYSESYLNYNELRPYFSECKAKHILVALDACYSGSFGTTRERARPDAPDYSAEADCVTQVSTAFRYGGRQYVCSGNKDARTPAKSAFAAKFLEALRKGPNADGLLFFDDLSYWLGKVRSPEPENGTFAGHEPAGDFVFVKKNACTANIKPDNTAADLAAWKKAKQLNTEAAFQEYLRQFPQGEFKALARQYIRDDGLILIKGGTFQMGSNDGPPDEKPLHSVKLSDFYLGKHEVTIAEFKIFIDATGYRTDADKEGKSRVYINKKWTDQNGINWKYDANGNLRSPSEYNHPVLHVSWNDAVEYCKWLSKKTEKTYRLPTEAEWEYAAGGGSVNRTKWAGTSDEKSLRKYANFSDNRDIYSTTSPVGRFLPNALGLYDMSGNVWEWCSDWYSPDYYKNSPSTNPNGPKSGTSRVLRGGSWFTWFGNTEICRLVNRYYSVLDTHSGYSGFRLAR